MGIHHLQVWRADTRVLRRALWPRVTTLLHGAYCTYTAHCMHALPALLPLLVDSRKSKPQTREVEEQLLVGLLLFIAQKAPFLTHPASRPSNQSPVCRGVYYARYIGKVKRPYPGPFPGCFHYRRCRRLSIDRVGRLSSATSKGYKSLVYTFRQCGCYIRQNTREKISPHARLVGFLPIPFVWLLAQPPLQGLHNSASPG